MNNREFLLLFSRKNKINIRIEIKKTDHEFFIDFSRDTMANPMFVFRGELSRARALIDIYRQRLREVGSHYCPYLFISTKFRYE